MKNKTWTVRLAAAGIIVAALGGVAFAVGQQGSQSDPLVTLSYLNEKGLPAVLAQVDTKLTEREKQLEDKLSSVKDDYLAEVNRRLNGQDTDAESAYVTVTLTAGQTLTAQSGCELLLRTGAVTVTGALLDMTDGSTLASGGALTANHLYLATADATVLNASNAVTLMARGSYTVS